MIPGRELGEAQWRATIDHVIPQSEGGHTRLDNLVLACQKCNSSRQAGKTSRKWRLHLEEIDVDGVTGESRFRREMLAQMASM